VGQDEVDIIRMADVSVVHARAGDWRTMWQALKAGIMEIADISVVNKSDRDGADRLVSAVEGNLALHAYGDAEWRPPIVKTIATTGARSSGGGRTRIARFASTDRHSRLLVGVRRSEYRLRELVTDRFMKHLEDNVLAEGEFKGFSR